MLIVLGLSLALRSGQAAAQDSPAFTPQEIGRILARGPWPPPAPRDSSNRVSGNTKAIALGERLFYSPRLSGSGGVLCASCHEPWRAYSDGRSRGIGVEPGERNTQSVINVRLQRWFGWDGANDNLWAQSIRPLLARHEMRSSAAQVAALMRADADLSLLYREAFGAPPSANDEALLVDVGKALAAYLETLVSGRTPFDDFRDALARGDAAAAARYPAQAQRGLDIFIGRGGCARCHAGPDFSDGAFHRSGVASRLANGEADSGRQDGIRNLLASRYNLVGPYNDDPARAGARATREASGEAGTANAFRTPGLRQVTLTAPYMHDGSLATLCEVLSRHPADPGGSGDTDAGGSGAAHADFNAADRNNLVAFLGTLTEADTRRYADADAAACR